MDVFPSIWSRILIANSCKGFGRRVAYLVLSMGVNGIGIISSSNLCTGFSTCFSAIIISFVGSILWLGFCKISFCSSNALRSLRKVWRPDPAFPNSDPSLKAMAASLRPSLR